MKNQWMKKKAAAVLALSTLALLSGCGKSPSATTPGGIGAPLGAGLTGGCIPITGLSQISFTANNMVFNNSNVMAGQLPAEAGGQVYGSVILGGAYAAP